MNKGNSRRSPVISATRTRALEPRSCWPHAKHWHVAVAALGIAWAAHVPVRAQPSGDAVRAQLSVPADETCLSAAVIAERVRARSQRIALSAEPGGTARFRVSVRADAPRGLLAELQVSWPDGRRSERQVAVASCDEASAALAFLITLTLDPQAAAQGSPRGTRNAPVWRPRPGPTPRNPDDQPRREEPAASAADGASPGSIADRTTAPDADAAPLGLEGDRAAAAPAGGAESGADADPRSNVAAASPAATAPEPEPRELGEGTFFRMDRIEIGLLAQLAVGVAPSAMPGLGVRVLAGFGGAGLWAPALQLRATRAWLDGWRAAGGVADFRLDSLRLDVCPIGVRWRGLAARGCLAGALGSLSAEGSQSFAPRSASKLWVDWGATLAISAELGPWLQVHLDTGLALPVHRDRYAFAPDVFHRVSAVGWQGDLGIGVRFP